MTEPYLEPNARDAIAGKDPEFDKAGKTHDWRNHVHEEVIDIWETFTREQRTAIVRWASEMADREEWE